MTDAPSYHDLHITTPTIPRTSIFNLPFHIRVECNRVSGWVVWSDKEKGRLEVELGGEYCYDPDTGEGAWLVLDVAGYVICDSRPKQEPT